ncbi:MAG: hypothetical protein NC548_33370 [Lachnospiraceae bacterium]|nr:hypothetical protein [Lachnospiraceae bacterium]
MYSGMPVPCSQIVNEGEHLNNMFLLIDSRARLLTARQDIDKGSRTDKQPQNWKEVKKDMDTPIANVKITSEGANAEVYMDGNKVNGLIGYEIIHDRTKSQVPVIRLNVQAKLNIETGMIPELPEPWKHCYSLNNQMPLDRRV